MKLNKSLIASRCFILSHFKPAINEHSNDTETLGTIAEDFCSVQTLVIENTKDFIQARQYSSRCLHAFFLHPRTRAFAISYRMRHYTLRHTLKKHFVVNCKSY